MTPILKRVIGGLNRNLITLSNVGSLFGTRVITSGFGFLFWTAAAQNFTSTEVGFGSAAVSAMMLLGTLGTMGFGTYLVGEIPKNEKNSEHIVEIALVLTSLFSLVFSLIFLVFLSPSTLGAFISDLPRTLIFVLGVAVTSMSIIIDHAAIGLLKGNIQLARNIIASVSKLILLVLVVYRLERETSFIIYSSWLVGNLLSFFSVKDVLTGKLFLFRGSNFFDNIKKITRSAIWHHLINLAMQAPTMMFPVIITSIVSASANAYYYMAIMIAGFVNVIPLAFSTVLFAMVSKAPDTFTEKLRASLIFSISTSSIGVIVLYIFAKWILGFLGEDYVVNGLWPVRLLLITTFPLTAKFYYVAVYRLMDKTKKIAQLLTSLLAFEILFVSIGGKQAGLIGFCVTWLVIQGLESLFFIPKLLKFIDRNSKIKSSLLTP